jgi:hypothetical protein
LLGPVCASQYLPWSNWSHAFPEGIIITLLYRYWYTYTSNLDTVSFIARYHSWDPMSWLVE